MPSIAKAHRIRDKTHQIKAQAPSNEIKIFGPILSDGEISPDGGVTPKSIRTQLESMQDANEITVRINSGGGSLEGGVAIYDAIMDMDAKVTVVVDGAAASSASIIAMAGDEVQMYPGSIMMIHNSSTTIEGQYSQTDIEGVLKDMRASDRGMAAIYADKTGMDIKLIQSMMKKETWMVGQEAIDLGFADTMLTKADRQKPVINAEARTITIDGVTHDFHLSAECPFFMKGADDVSKKKFAQVDEEINTPVDNPETEEKTEEPKAAAEEEKCAEEVEEETVAEETEEETTAEDPEDEPMTAAKLAILYPEVVEEIRQAAIEEEQERIAGIEEIQDQIGDEELVQEAKFSAERMSAEKLAFVAMRKKTAAVTGKKPTASKYLENLKKDRQASGTAKVKTASAPVIKPKKASVEKEAADFMTAFLKGE